MISHDKHLNYRSPKLETEPNIDIGRRLYSLGNKDLDVGGGGSESIVCITNVKGLKENRCVFFVAILWIL